MTTKQQVIVPHGRIFEGTVISAKAQKTATVEWLFTKKVAKYERYEKKRTRVKAHNPQTINAEKGDKVRIQECRPLSKTKHFIIISKLEKDKAYLVREEGMELSKFKRPKKEESNLAEEDHESN
ncbi:30S ribosomal protein S17 [Candidatus Woesearchaeota archaeon]|nr:30S ribosomal protein S17 [Candidatus Woesearchaeota archaeon]